MGGRGDEAVAWVTVERGERDAQRFWLSLIAALADAAGDEVIERVSPAPSFAGAAVVERLLAQLERLEAPLELVIDDLHELGTDDALAWLELLLARVPAQLRGRARDSRGAGARPASPEGRGRVDRAARVGPALLHRRDARPALCERDPRSDERRRARCRSVQEGWRAGVRLAAISLRSHPDPERFVSKFSGSERTVAGTLPAEVNERQPTGWRPPPATAVLERVSGPLADALTGGTGSEAILQQLEDQNAFVTALECARTWFRCHRLFADLLRLELRRTAPATHSFASPRGGRLARGARRGDRGRPAPSSSR